jgi:hypothetical protein
MTAQRYHFLREVQSGNRAWLEITADVPTPATPPAPYFEDIAIAEIHGA